MLSIPKFLILADVFNTYANIGFEIYIRKKIFTFYDFMYPIPYIWCHFIDINFFLGKFWMLEWLNFLFQVFQRIQDADLE